MSQTSNIEQLVFQGGSVKGIAYVGAIEALRTHLGPEDFQKIDKIAGTSAGAITALTIALGYSSDELIQLLTNIEFQDFLDDENSFVSKDAITKKQGLLAMSSTSSLASSQFLLQGTSGLYPGKFVLNWLEKLIEGKTGKKFCTFQELHDLRTANPLLKDLYVVAFNLNRQVACTFGYQQTPSVVISDAVRASMSIPFLFQAHRIREKKSSQSGAKSEYNHTDFNHPRDLWIDGGVVENFPIRIFDSMSKRNTTLGFALCAKDQINALENNYKELPREELNNALSYTLAVISSLLHSTNQFNYQLRSTDNKRSVYIDHVDVGMLEFNLTMDKKNKLIQSGWDSTCRWLERKDLVGKCAITIQDQPKAAPAPVEVNNNERAKSKSSSACTIV